MDESKTLEISEKQCNLEITLLDFFACYLASLVPIIALIPLLIGLVLTFTKKDVPTLQKVVSITAAIFVGFMVIYWFVTLIQNPPVLEESLSSLS